jgi:hypothetical protein
LPNIFSKSASLVILPGLPASFLFLAAIFAYFLAAISSIYAYLRSASLCCGLRFLRESSPAFLSPPDLNAGLRDIATPASAFMRDPSKKNMLTSFSGFA